ncbi:PhzF family phenazine biosynthesis protein [Saccharibacillus sp. CPCC 101409]|uniref:PhzF family phenazine biosynthesis protein n=1 Tax=Saccharibacillus sp. CPCC 101409 TaxID=3058041 RepID=UPI002672921F|nr:PhzF family phenazine biosynthesis protein [Saccharibacillus sp. CPCC 101409]MDO3410470.1 PhzF family phenazine biosynthesis protein [Saccharibacillus sp. CPCC 101409]
MKMYIVDAFADRPFKGNPAAVCLLDEERSEEWMQTVAAEMNLSETAFLLPQAGGYSLRWFTPAAEVDLCGHATLASAHVLWTEAGETAETLAFATRSGRLTAVRAGSGIELDFPLEPPQPCEAPPELAAGLGVIGSYIGRNRMDYFVELQNEDTLAALKPDFAALRGLEARGVIVTARSQREGVDFVSRCFYPGIGVDEDPVTGSAHCALGPYWRGKLGRGELSALQLSAREGRLSLSVGEARIRIGGSAATVLRGELT